MLALDISQSMETPDFRTPGGKRMRRIDAVKQVVTDFIRTRKIDRIGLIAVSLSLDAVSISQVFRSETR